jgi:hypothetical protein
MNMFYVGPTYTVTRTQGNALSTSDGAERERKTSLDVEHRGLG